MSKEQALGCERDVFVLRTRVHESGFDRGVSHGWMVFPGDFQSVPGLLEQTSSRPDGAAFARSNTLNR
jgi:hypothetical protein